MQAKPLDFHRQLSGVRDLPTTSFNASAGWLWRFCKQHGIRQLRLQGEKASTYKPAVEQFVPDFQAFVREREYSLHQVFNGDETGFFYYKLPSKNPCCSF